MQDVTVSYDQLVIKVHRGPSRDTNETDDDMKTDAAFGFTPMGASLSYYSSPDLWQKITAEALKSSISGQRGRPALVKNLYRITHGIGKRLVISGKGRDAREGGLAQVAWKRSAPNKNSNAEWLHCLLQYAVTDRVIFAVSDMPVEDCRPLQSPVMKSFPLPNQMERVFEIARNWKKTVTKFFQEWENAYHLNNNRALFPNICAIQDDHDPTTTTNGAYGSLATFLGDNGQGSVTVNTQMQESTTAGDTVLKSLVGGIRQSYTTSRINMIFNNFCLTALALRSMMLVCAEYDVQYSRLFEMCVRREANLCRNWNSRVIRRR